MYSRGLTSLCTAWILVGGILAVSTAAAVQGESVFKDPESLLRSFFASVSFAPRATPDWDHVRKFFIPEAVFAVRQTRTSMAALDLDQFAAWWEADIQEYKMKERGFQETIERSKFTVFGDMAQCFVVYKAKFKIPADAPGQIGLDNYSLVKKEGRWWIVSVTNEIPTPQRPLPEELR